MVTRRRAYYIGLLALCVATRLATTIHYVEDTDSLRFALSVADEFDVAGLQPHFPGYPVFWAAAKVLYWITGSFAMSFSLIGGLATFAVVYYGLQLSRRDPLTIEGLAIAFVLFFNPMIWLMGNRYMPDLMGLAVALAALSLLLSSRPSAGGVATGLLAGTRLSYAPLLLPVYVYALRNRPLRLLAASAAGALVWLIPMIIDTGLSGLIGAATRQTEGHFTEFGGTIETNPALLRRVIRLAEALLADGFGAWWPGRHWLTLLVAAALLAAAIALCAQAVRGGKSTTDFRPPTSAESPRRTLLIIAALTYATWIFLFQNVIYKSRHVLPLVALLAIPLGLALAHLIRAHVVGARTAAASFAGEYDVTPPPAGATMSPAAAVRTAATRTAAVRTAATRTAAVRTAAARTVATRTVAAVAAAAYAAVTLVLVLQHREPTAIAQVKDFVQETRPNVVASIPLVNYYLSAQGVDATFLSVQNQEDRERIALESGKLLIIGRYPDLMPPNPAGADTFYHNPYVNRMWPEVEVYVYER